MTYRRGPDEVSEEVETLIVNRLLLLSFRAVKDAALDFPGRLPERQRPRRRLLESTVTSGKGLAQDVKRRTRPPAAKPIAYSPVVRPRSPDGSRRGHEKWFDATAHAWCGQDRALRLYVAASGSLAYEPWPRR